MKKTIFMSAIIIALSLSIFGQTTDKQTGKTNKAEQAIIALANDYANASVKGDVAAIERLLTDDYLDVFSPIGTVRTKSEIINSYKTPPPTNVKLEAIDITNPKVRLYGNTAIEIAGLTLRYKTADGKTVTYDFTAAIVAVKEKEQWKIASFIASYISPVPTAANSSNEMKNTEQSVMALSAEYAKAFVKRDAAAMEKLLADNFVEILPNGSRLVKADYINNYKTPLPANSGTLDMPELSSPKVNMFGDTAIMTARVSTRSQDAEGKTVNGDFLYTMTAIENNGRWQIAGLQSIEIPSRTPPAGMGNHCKFDKGPRAGQTQDYSYLKPLPLGTPCQDGRGSTGKVVAP